MQRPGLMPASRVQPTQPTQPAEYSEFEAQIDRIDAEIFYFETLLQQSRLRANQEEQQALEEKMELDAAEAEEAAAAEATAEDDAFLHPALAVDFQIIDSYVFSSDQVVMIPLLSGPKDDSKVPEADPMDIKAQPVSKLQKALLHNSVKLTAPSKDAASQEQLLIEKIYEKNRSIAKKTNALIGSRADSGGSPIYPSMPDVPASAKLASLLSVSHSHHHPIHDTPDAVALLPHLARKIRRDRYLLKSHVSYLSKEYTRLDEIWRKKTRKLEEKLERANERRARKEQQAGFGGGASSNPLKTLSPSGGSSSSLMNASSSNPAAAGHHPGSHAGRRSGGFSASDAVRSEAELESVLAMLMSNEVPVERIAPNVDMVLDPHERSILMMKNNNNLVTDPQSLLAEENVSSMMRWSEDERSAFLHNFQIYGKAFNRIALHLPNKTTADCVEYYYREKQNICTKLVARHSQALALRVANAQAAAAATGVYKKARGPGASRRSKATGGDAGESSGGEFGYPNTSTRGGAVDRRTTAGRLLKEKEKKEAAALTGNKRGKVHWTAEEKVAVQHAFGQFGRDWPAVVRCLHYRKTEMDVSAFFDKYKKKLALAQVVLSAEARLGKNFDGFLTYSSYPITDLAPAPDSVPATPRAVTPALRNEDGSVGYQSPTSAPSPTPGAPDTPNTPARRQQNYWSVVEKDTFYHALVKYGRNWDQVSITVGSKTAPQCRNYFANYRHKLQFDALLEQHGHGVGGETRGPMSARRVLDKNSASPVSSTTLDQQKQAVQLAPSMDAESGLGQRLLAPIRNFPPPPSEDSRLGPRIGGVAVGKPAPVSAATYIDPYYRNFGFQPGVAETAADSSSALSPNRLRKLAPVGLSTAEAFSESVEPSLRLPSMRNLLGSMYPASSARSEPGDDVRPVGQTDAAPLSAPATSASFKLPEAGGSERRTQLPGLGRAMSNVAEGRPDVEIGFVDVVRADVEIGYVDVVRPDAGNGFVDVVRADVEIGFVDVVRPDVEIGSVNQSVHDGQGSLSLARAGSVGGTPVVRPVSEIALTPDPPQQQMVLEGDLSDSDNMQE